MKLILTIALMLGTAMPATAQAQTAPIIIHGVCDTKSGVTIDDGEPSAFGCNAAVVIRTERGSLLIQFADKTGDDGRLIGFAGMIEGKQGFGADTTQMMAVERIYLGSSTEPITARKGTCILNWTGLHRTGGKLTSLVCAGLGDVDGSNVKAMAFLEAR